MLLFHKKNKIVLAVLMAFMLCLSGCSVVNGSDPDIESGTENNAMRYLRIANEEPDTADPQCTDYYYAIPLNVFDRLVEVQVDSDGTRSFIPSLADSWEVSDDGLVYIFHLHSGVKFSNGSPLTSSDVEYTLIRAITHPGSHAGDIGEFIMGAQELMDGKTDKLEGFSAQSDLDFSITLSVPYTAFLAMLSTPAYSILDEESTEAAGDSFGTNPVATIGTGPFLFKKWDAGDEIILDANPNCWAGAPGCGGISMQFVQDAEARRIMYEEGELDILDLENMGEAAEFIYHGDIYENQLVYGNRVGLTYIALNESVEPLGDVRVRQALQLALDRDAILMCIYSGRGYVENGIYPHGLAGHDETLPEIPYDPQTAAELLKEAGYPDGFDLELSVDDESSYYSREILELAADMWKKIGVRATIKTIDEDSFLEQRKNGQLACYTRRFSVDYDDPDAIIYVFFGSKENAHSNSLCYDREDIMNRVADACCIVNEEKRIREYRELERIIVQEDCAWIPLFSNRHYFAVNERVRNFQVPWNGWSDIRYDKIMVEAG